MALKALCGEGRRGAARGRGCAGIVDPNAWADADGEEGTARGRIVDIMETTWAHGALSLSGKSFDSNPDHQGMYLITL